MLLAKVVALLTICGISVATRNTMITRSRTTADRLLICTRALSLLIFFSGTRSINLANGRRRYASTRPDVTGDM